VHFKCFAAQVMVMALVFNHHIVPETLWVMDYVEKLYRREENHYTVSKKLYLMKEEYTWWRFYFMIS
jgi:hypothetical protein